MRWVAESKQPYKIVSDHGFQSLMKTGRPDYHIPSEQTVSRDVKQVFIHARKRVANMLQEYEGQLIFATDAWTSPNHKAFVAFTVHFAHEGSQFQCFSTLLKSLSRIQGSILLKPSPKSLKISGSVIR